MARLSDVADAIEAASDDDVDALAAEALALSEAITGRLPEAMRADGGAGDAGGTGPLTRA